MLLEMPRLQIVSLHLRLGFFEVAEEAFAGAFVKFVDEAVAIFAAYVEDFEGVIYHRKVIDHVGLCLFLLLVGG